MRRMAIIVFLGAALALECAAADRRPGDSLLVGPCDRSAQDNPTHTACLMKEVDRLTPVVERYVMETRQGFRAAAARALADGSRFEAESYTEALGQFEKAQSLWVSFRDAHCAMMENQITGSGRGAAPYRCKVLITYERLRQMAAIGFISTPDPASLAQFGVAADSRP